MDWIIPLANLGAAGVAIIVIILFFKQNRLERDHFDNTVVKAIEASTAQINQNIETNGRVLQALLKHDDYRKDNDAAHAEIHADVKHIQNSIGGLKI